MWQNHSPNCPVVNPVNQIFNGFECSNNVSVGKIFLQMFYQIPVSWQTFHKRSFCFTKKFGYSNFNFFLLDLKQFLPKIVRRRNTAYNVEKDRFHFLKLFVKKFEWMIKRQSQLSKWKWKYLYFNKSYTLTQLCQRALTQ